MKNNKKQLHEALAVLLTKLSSARDNPWISILMKSMNINSSIDEHITDEAVDNMIESMLGKEQS